MMQMVLISIGGFLGAISRFAIGNVLKKKSKQIPLGTLFVNVTGAFLLGLLVGTGTNKNVNFLFGTGFMGAFTTFSTLKVEMIQLIEKREFKSLLNYLLLTYIGGIFLAFVGMYVGQLL